MGCEHYQRHCELQAPCCKEFYSCRICHDEHQETEDTLHTIKETCLETFNRHRVMKVRCNDCRTIQSVGKECTSCFRYFAYYYCTYCCLFDDDKSHDIFHCNKCGICRKGLPSSYFHCTTCHCCLDYTLKNNHICRERSLDVNCPICLENLFSSRTATSFTPCGHALHATCYKRYVEHGNWKCPICAKPLFSNNQQAAVQVVPEQMSLIRTVIRLIIVTLIIFILCFLLWYFGGTITEEEL